MSMMERNGVGDLTGFPEACRQMGDPARTIKHEDGIKEIEMVIYDIVEKLLLKTGVQPCEIGIVITACSCFAPTPSMGAMLVNRFKMRRDVLTYSLAGMGCSSSVVCVDMARHLLKALPNSLCLIVNHEHASSKCVYEGNDRSMLMCNTLFRLGGAAALMSNRPCDLGRAKYELRTTLCTHMGADDDAHRCMANATDATGLEGIYLRKNIIEVAGRALRENLTALAPHVLPLRELAKCLANRKYTPDFRTAFDHFLLHTGGRGVLDSLEKTLQLTEQHMEPARGTLELFGNLSAASTWYILAGIESSIGVRKGDRLWQLGFGGGFKANSAVWRARRNILQAHNCWD